MRPITVTVGPLAAASANSLALAQTPAAGAVTLNGSLASGGIVTMDTPRRVLITTTGNESTNTFTITGTNWSGNPISESLLGANIGTSQSVLDYATVASIKIANNAAAAFTIGTNGVASSPWIRLDEWALPQTSLQFDVTGTVSYTVQQTLDDPNSPTNPVASALVNWVNSSDASVVNATTTAQSNYAYSPTYVRILLNSGSGSVTGKLVQSGVVPI
jgi:hypothetical protein